MIRGMQNEKAWTLDSRGSCESSHEVDIYKVELTKCECCWNGGDERDDGTKDGFSHNV